MFEKSARVTHSPVDSNKWSLYLIELIVIVFVVLWIYTGIGKIADQFNFVYQLEKQSFLRPFATIIGVMVPAVELLTALLLLIPRTKYFALWISAILMVAFTAYVAVILSFSKEVPCYCGGIMSTLNWHQHLVVNSILTILAFVGIYLFKRSRR